MNQSSATLRQQIRRQQRGQLNKSVLTALAVTAFISLIATQWTTVTTLSAHVADSFVMWTAEQGFVVKRLDVTGRNQVPPAEMLQALQVKQNMPILAYHPQEAVKRLSTNPWFRTVNVERRLPDTVFVRVEERIPAARWQMQGRLAVIDVEGVVLTTENLDMYKDLPIIIGQEARHKVIDLFSLLHGEAELAKEVTAATWIGNRRWNLTLKNGVVLKLPAQDPQLALSLFAAMDKKENILERDIISVDLRLPQQIIMQPTVRANAVIERPDFSDTPDARRQAI